MEGTQIYNYNVKFQYEPLGHIPWDEASSFGLMSSHYCHFSGKPLFLTHLIK